MVRIFSNIANVSIRILLKCVLPRGNCDEIVVYILSASRR